MRMKNDGELRGGRGNSAPDIEGSWQIKLGILTRGKAEKKKRVGPVCNKNTRGSSPGRRTSVNPLEFCHYDRRFLITDNLLNNK